MAFFSSRETCACEMPISPETSICVLSVVKAHALRYAARAVEQFVHRFAHGAIRSSQTFVGVARVAHLIDRRRSVSPPSRVDGVEEGDGIDHRVHAPNTTSSRGTSERPWRSARRVGSFPVWFSRMQLFPDACSTRVGRCRAWIAADADGAVVAQIAADLADDHGHAVGRRSGRSARRRNCRWP